MTLQELIDALAARPLVLVLVFVGTVTVAYLVGQLHGAGRGGETPWRYVYATLVYAACIPGVFATLLTLYSVLFLRASLLQVDILVYFLPIVAMIATLGIIRRSADLDSIPGFDRLSGLIVLMALSFGVVFLLSRLFVGVIFFGSIAFLATLAVAVFAVLRWSAGVVFRRRDAPRPRFPSL